MHACHIYFGVGVAVLVVQEYLFRIFAGEEHLVSEQVVHETAETEYVRFLVVGKAFQHIGVHVSGRAALDHQLFVVCGPASQSQISNAHFQFLLVE